MFNKLLKISLFLIILFVIKNSYSDFIIRVQSPGFDKEEIKDIHTKRYEPYVKEDLKPNTDYYYKYLDKNISVVLDNGLEVEIKPTDTFKYTITHATRPNLTCPNSWTNDELGHCLKEENQRVNELLHAIENQRNSEVQKLLEAGANPALANKSGFNALTLAITSGYPDTVNAIFEALKKSNKKEIIAELVNMPANMQDKKGESPLQLAERMARDYSPKEAYQKIIKILQDNGAKKPER